MSGGGKGGSQTSSVELPDWLDSAAEAAVGQGQRIGQIGYVPYHGPDVAAMSPMQQAAMENTSEAASAFGLSSGGGSGLPAPETFANGMQGYSSRPLYAEAKDWLARARPGQYNYMQDFFVGPQTGEAGQFAAENTSPLLNPEAEMMRPSFGKQETLQSRYADDYEAGGVARGDGTGFGRGGIAETGFGKGLL